MKKSNALVLGLAVLLAFGCGEEEKKKEDPTPQNPVYGNRVCLPIEHPTDKDDSKWTYFYNASGQIVKTTRKSQTTGVDEKELIEYNSQGLISKIRIYQSNVLRYYNLYDYSADSLLLRDSGFELLSPDTTLIKPAGVYEYEYDASKRLIKSRNFPPGQPNNLYGFTVITYGPNGTVKINGYGKTTSNLKAITEYQFLNNSKIPGGKLPYFNLVNNSSKYSLDRRFSALPASMSVELYDNGSVTQKTSFNYSYIFNSDGYPTEQTITSPNQTVFKNYWTYNCQ